MKKTLLAAALASTLLLSACGSNEKNTMSAFDAAPRNAEAGEYLQSDDNAELETTAPSELRRVELLNADYQAVRRHSNQHTKCWSTLVGEH